MRREGKKQKKEQEKNIRVDFKNVWFAAFCKTLFKIIRLKICFSSLSLLKDSSKYDIYSKAYGTALGSDDAKPTCF